MANLKLHTIGIHGGFHHNFLYTVVRTVTGIVQWLTVQTDHPLTRATHSFRFVESATAGTTATRARRSLDVRSSNASGKVSSG